MHCACAATFVTLFPGIPVMYATLLRKHRALLSDPVALAEEEAAGYPTTGHLLFLVSAYKPEFYYFEVVESARRLLLASVLGMVAADSAAAPVSGVLICIFFNYLFSAYNPFKAQSASNLGAAASVSLTLLFFAAVLIKVDASPDDSADQTFLGTVLIAVLLASPVILLTSSCIDRRRAQKLAIDSGLSEKDLQGCSRIPSKMPNIIAAGPLNLSLKTHETELAPRDSHTRDLEPRGLRI